MSVLEEFKNVLMNKPYWEKLAFTETGKLKKGTKQKLSDNERRDYEAVYSRFYYKNIGREVRMKIKGSDPSKSQKVYRTMLRT